MELARTLCASDSPINKSQLARTLGIARSSLYTHPKRPKMDKELAVRIEELHEQDDTMGHRKLAALLHTGKNRVKRVMHKYGIAARRKRKRFSRTWRAQPLSFWFVKKSRKNICFHQELFLECNSLFLARLRGD